MLGYREIYLLESVATRGDNRKQTFNKPSLIFFDAKKEHKKHLENPPKPKNALRLILF